jgi:hypothetical protein
MYPFPHDTISRKDLVAIDEQLINHSRDMLAKARMVLESPRITGSHSRRRGPPMKQMQAHLERLREHIAECESIRDSAANNHKREVFADLAEHFKTLAANLEREIAAVATPSDTFLGRKTYEPFPRENDQVR